VEFISIHDIQSELGYSDPRSAVKWCEEHNVLLTDRGKISHAIKVEFFEQLDKPFINELKAKYGNNWEVAYKYCKEGNVTALHSLLENTIKNSLPKKSKTNSINKYNNLFEQYAKTKAA